MPKTTGGMSIARKVTVEASLGLSPVTSPNAIIGEQATSIVPSGCPFHLAMSRSIALSSLGM